MGERTKDLLWRLVRRGFHVASRGTIPEPVAETGSPDPVVLEKVPSYETLDPSRILRGMGELGISPGEVQGKTVLLKPNLVEPAAGIGPVNTHPAVLRAAAEAFLHLGAKRILVGDGPAHCQDSEGQLEGCGLRELLSNRAIRFVDLNFEAPFPVPNRGGLTRLSQFTLPSVLREVEWVVSVPKLKTHRWTGVSLSLKNLFGLLPGLYYGWPKNLLHWEGIDRCIYDLNASVPARFAIVDGVVGMEGDGPLSGSPREAGVLVMGRSLPAVDATAARIMGIDPARIPHLAFASGRLGKISETRVEQRGEKISDVRSDFALVEAIHAHRGIRLAPDPRQKS